MTLQEYQELPGHYFVQHLGGQTWLVYFEIHAPTNGTVGLDLAHCPNEATAQQLVDLLNATKAAKEEALNKEAFTHFYA
jgi:hypothetical protein